ncbi:MAG: cyclodeaminase/cyclohydrolase family protein [Calditrichaeota bacterium]|nr:cyclodeaminase/cyclohydrolase family protein [Calditrichota bacterium]MCB9391925.1 cyclodeaminase/cyclohydrolase family protein [Calditrichota bacterium]
MSNMPDTPARLIYQPVAGFIEQVASKAPAPGGGSAAALSGAIGAALLVMVCEFTIGKKGFEEVSDELSAAKAKAEELRHALTRQVDLDTWAFNRFRSANRLPDATPDDKAHKERELSESTRDTIEVPRQTMLQCLRALGEAHVIIEKGNPNTVSDAATGSEMLLAGLEGAANNVLINLLDRSDTEAEQLRVQVRGSRKEARALVETLRNIVLKRLRG